MSEKVIKNEDPEPQAHRANDIQKTNLICWKSDLRTHEAFWIFHDVNKRISKKWVDFRDGEADGCTSITARTVCSHDYKFCSTHHLRNIREILY